MRARHLAKLRGRRVASILPPNTAGFQLRYARHDVFHDSITPCPPARSRACRTIGGEPGRNRCIVHGPPNGPSKVPILCRHCRRAAGSHRCAMISPLRAISKGKRRTGCPPPVGAIGDTARSACANGLGAPAAPYSTRWAPSRRNDSATGQAEPGNPALEVPGAFYGCRACLRARATRPPASSNHVRNARTAGWLMLSGR